MPSSRPSNRCSVRKTTEVRDLIGDLGSEQQDLDELLSGLDDPSWDIVTPAEPWTIRDTVSHLAFFDERQVQAILDPDTFAAEINLHLKDGIDDYIGLGIGMGRSMSPASVLDWWRSARTAALDAFARVGPEDRLPWFGPPMKGRSAVTARLMETWAHGHDVAEAAGVQRPSTDRLFPIAELGVKTFSWSFANRGLEVPVERVRVELVGPSDATRVWNDTMVNSITGPVDEFCLVVAQRKNLLDTALAVEGDVARRWMEIAQVFAGPPGPGRPAVIESSDLRR
jgi:uncharacterized protein (TIGR03084 family)